MKSCSKCKRQLPSDKNNFYTEKRNKSGLSSQCKKCIDFTNKQYAMKNKEKVRKVWVKHYENNTDKVKLRAQLFRLSNKEQENKDRRVKYKTNAKYKERVTRATKKYFMNNPHKNAEAKQIRRSLERSLIATFSKDQWDSCLKSFNNICAYCGQGGEKLTQEHFVPVSKNGEYTVGNIIPACSTCNCSKGNREFNTWYKQQEFYSKSREIKILKYLGYENNMQQMALL